MEKKKRPAHEIRLGRIRATIWKNESENGRRYDVTLTRLYRIPEDKREDDDDNGWRETSSFSEDELVVALRLGEEALRWTLDRP